MLCLPPERVAAPAAFPITLAEAKAHLRVDHDLEDALITSIIGAVTAALDGYSGILGRALIEQTWREFFTFWPASRTIYLALAPVSEIVSISARTVDGAVVEVDAGSYRLLGGQSRPMVRFEIDADLPALAAEPDALVVEYLAGYGAEGTDVPADIRHEMLMMIGDRYRFTETEVAGPSAQRVSPQEHRRLFNFIRGLVG